MWDDTILLRISRQFAKEEAFAELLRIIKAVQYENGELKSEIAELKHVPKNKKVLIEEEGKTKKVWLKDGLIASMQVQINTLKERNRGMENSIREWRDKYYAKINQENLASCQ